MGIGKGVNLRIGQFARGLTRSNRHKPKNAQKTTITLSF